MRSFLALANDERSSVTSFSCKDVMKPYDFENFESSNVPDREENRGSRSS